jgi:GT2 family glycosyltransferase
MKKPKVSIIIVNFNGGEIFKDCLSSVKKLNYPNYQLVIVDNASSDGTEKYATIRNKKNLGFVGGNNIGVEKSSGKYILLLNNDTTVSPDLLNVLVDKMETDPKIGVLQPKIYLMDKLDYLDNAGSFFTKIGFLDHWGFMKKDDKEFDKEKEVFSAKGACMLIRKDLVDSVGLFDKDYFAYFEESDFCWKAWLYDKKVVYYPKTYIKHKVGFTTKTQNVNFLNYLYYRNRICSLIKNLETKNLLWIIPVHIFISLGIAFIFLIRGSWSNCLLILRAVKWNILNINSTLKKRKQIQKIRKISDNEIFTRVGRKVDLNKFFSDFKRVEKDLK